MSAMDRAQRHDPAAIWPVPDAFRAIYSHAVELPPGMRLLLLSGQIGVAPDGRVADGFTAQCKQAMANIEALLAAGKMTRSDIAKATFYLTDAADLPVLSEMRREYWGAAAPPAVTTLVVAALARPDLRIEIEIVAAAPATGDGS